MAKLHFAFVLLEAAETHFPVSCVSPSLSDAMCRSSYVFLLLKAIIIGKLSLFQPIYKKSSLLDHFVGENKKWVLNSLVVVLPKHLIGLIF
jgi:hypothetical protein